MYLCTAFAVWRANFDKETAILVVILDIAFFFSFYLVDIFGNKERVYRANLELKRKLGLPKKIEKVDLWYLFVFLNFLFIFHTVWP